MRFPNHPEFLIDSVKVIFCDSSGGIYNDPKHGITLHIPNGAIDAETTLEIVIGIFLYGNFEFPKQMSPVSAIIWLCTPQPYFSFHKPIKIILPHFMNCKTNEDATNLELQFMKAANGSSADANIMFSPANGEQDFQSIPFKGILYTQHFCYICITSGINERQLRERRLCISCAEPKYPQSMTAKIIFFITYFNETCLEVTHYL